MGIDSDVRDFLERVARRCFYPQPIHGCSDFAYPMLSNFSAFVDDLNSLVRALGLIYPGCKSAKPWYCRVWGDVYRRVGVLYNQRFAAGLIEGRVTLDCCTPPNKAKEQATREEASVNRNNPGNGSPRAKKLRFADQDGNAIDDPQQQQQQQEPPIDIKELQYKWPKDEDGSEWFKPGTAIQCDWGGIMYSDDTRAKILFTQALTHYMLYELPMPPNCSILLDCCVIDGKWVRQPIRLRYVHPFDPLLVTEEDIRMAASVGQASRRIEFDMGHEKQTWFGEADDRIIENVLHLTIVERKSVVVFSGDGDTDIALINTLRVRREIQRNGPPEFRVRPGERLPWVVHAMPRMRKYSDANGMKRELFDTIVIDTDQLALWVETHYVGAALVCQEKKSHPDLIDGGALFSVLVALRKTDYTESYPFMSMANIFEAFEKNPQLFISCIETHIIEDKEMLGVFTIVDCRIHVPSFRRFMEHAINVSRLNKAAQCRQPSEVPQPSAAAAKRKKPPNYKDKLMTNAGVESMAMRIVWLVDKYLNGGIPGYNIADPFEKHAASGKSLYGYERVKNAETDKEEVIFTLDVHHREWATIVRV